MIFCQGYTLSWMSQHGFFPLDNIVHIDPDAFKMMMPEWPDYVARDRDSAGTMCHMESSFMVEAMVFWDRTWRKEDSNPTKKVIEQLIGTVFVWNWFSVSFGGVIIYRKRVKKHLR